MDVKFTEESAERLILEMDYYINQIQEEAVAIHELLTTSDSWDDSQSRQFYEQLMNIGRQLVEAVNNQQEYKTIFQKKVNELKG